MLFDTDVSNPHSATFQDEKRAACRPRNSFLHTGWRQPPQESAWLSKSSLNIFGFDIFKSWTVSRRNILYD